MSRSRCSSPTTGSTLGKGASRLQRFRAQLTLPNQLTLLRLLLVPVIGMSLEVQFAYHDQVGAGVYVLAAATDTLDGHIARSRKLVTELGKFLDPLVDKLLVITVLAILVSQEVLAFWVVVVIFARSCATTRAASSAACEWITQMRAPPA